MKDTLIKILKVTISILSIIYVLSIVPYQTLFELFNSFDLGTIFLISIVILMSIFVSSLSLYFLFDTSMISYWRVFQIDSFDFVANSFIPSRAGSIVSAPILFDRYSNLSKGTVIESKLIQFQIIGAITGLFALIGTIILSDSLRVEAFSGLMLSCAAYLGLPIIIQIEKSKSIFRKSTNYIPKVNIGSKVDGNVEISTRAGILVTVIVLLTVVLLPGLRLGIILSNTEFQLEYYLLLIAPVTMYSVTILPISVGGVGVAEASGTAVLSAFGVPPVIAASVVLIDRTVSTYFPLLLMYLYANYLLHFSSLTAENKHS